MSFIQWYPGHMHLTRQLIEERIKAIDVVIEVLDARIPGSSFNPLLQTLTGHKPRVKLLNKRRGLGLGLCLGDVRWIFQERFAVISSWSRSSSSYEGLIS